MAARSLAIAVALVLSMGVRAYAFEQYVIPSESMSPTLQVSDHVIVEKAALDLNGVGPGDVVVFDRPASLGADGPSVLIKRIIAGSGQTVQARRGVVVVDGVAMSEPYTSGPTADFGPITIAAGDLFVMGDNRRASTDSRVFGPVPESSVVGSAFLRAWPVGRLGLM